MFKECPHPDEKQRLQLSRELGLAPRQIKFWFQNRRTQMKVSNSMSFLFLQRLDFGASLLYKDSNMFSHFNYCSGTT